ncbi:MAG: malto-oligosyltrehalose synthase [Solirubrobacteraceae bacterium]
MSREPRLRATYRLQLGPTFGFGEARALVPYLRRLGVSHLYLSPSLQARHDSTHGYDVVDPLRVSDALGGETALRALAGAGLPLILDTVPNHMGIGPENRYWNDPALRDRWFDVDPLDGRHRRFFDVDDMAAIRQEDPDVFETSHRLLLRLVRERVVDGLRIDHPDGLADPAAYLGRLRDAGVDRVWVEKILHPGEALRDWPVCGTVGYEFLGDAGALFVDPRAEGALTACHATFCGEGRTFAAVAREAQLEVARTSFRHELERLSRLDPRHGPEELAQALAALPVYRTYVEPHARRVEPADRAAVEAAGLCEPLRRALLLEAGDSPPPEFVTRFQQTSPAINAKGIEDTAFYRHLRLISLNEVGGDPDRFSLDVDSFHAGNLERAKRFPSALLATQTHDTKRSGDARARIGALSAHAAEWCEQVERWRVLNAPFRSGAAPDPPEEYLLYQTLIGSWPIDPDRLTRFLEKALREAKRNSGWLEPNVAWETAVLDFARAVVGHERFLAAFEPFCERVRASGECSALGQLLLKLTSPGVPDIYQGDELWCLSLVDPDNRRPVDWERRREALSSLSGGVVPDTRKLALIERALELRGRRPDAFAGAYRPLAAGPDVCAFTRGEDDVLAAVALREPGAGATIELHAPARWRDVRSGATRRLGRSVETASLLDSDGLALFERER